MTGEAIFWLALYGAFAAAAFAATFRDGDLFWVGFWLVSSFATSNFLWLLSVPAADRPGVYTMLEVIVAVASYCAWGNHPCPALKVLVAVNALSICANIAFAAIISPTWRQVHAWEVTTNLCFAIECMLAIGVGLHGRRVSRFNWWPFVGRNAAATHVARAADGEPR